MTLQTLHIIKMKLSERGNRFADIGFARHSGNRRN